MKRKHQDETTKKSDNLTSGTLGVVASAVASSTVSQCDGTSTYAAGSSSPCDYDAAGVVCESPQTGPDIALE